MCKSQRNAFRDVEVKAMIPGGEDRSATPGYAACLGASKAHCVERSASVMFLDDEVRGGNVAGICAASSVAL